MPMKLVGTVSVGLIVNANFVSTIKLGRDDENVSQVYGLGLFVVFRTTY